jgi:two-component system, sensor histidine kinase and response regulator
MGTRALPPAVLLVDDVEANLVALSAQLQNLGCELVLASSGNEALKQLLRREFAVVLLDVQMPGMDGLEVAQLARENPDTREVPIIFVTAMHENPDTVLKSYGTGAVDLLFKPVNPSVLRSKVRVFLELYLGRRKLAGEIEAHRATMAELDAFSYSVAHDLRAPLRAIRGYAQILLEEEAATLAASGAKRIDEIVANAAHMSALIDSLLSLSQVTRGRLRYEEVDLSELVRQEGRRLAAAEPQRAVELVVRDGVRAQVDRALARTLVQNLIGNAWKFTGRTTAPRIELGVEERQDERVLFIRDNGAGFAPAYAAKLFAPFQRLHTVEQFAGTGIGLATTQRIVRRHGGRIWAEGAVGQGATFYFTLPEAEASGAPRTAEDGS